MKMAVLKKLTTLNNLIIVGLVIIVQFIGCTYSDTEANVGYGKSYFMQHCASCHGRYQGFQNAPGILTLYTYDSLTLLKKLENIKEDSLHKNYLNYKYSEYEIKSLLIFIRKYFDPVN